MKESVLTDNLQEDLLSVKKIINKNLSKSDNNVARLLGSLNASGGKLLRATFVIIGGSFGNIDKNKLNNMAAAVELLHLGTLVHDDIVDDSDIRRGCKTINRNFGDKAALFIGDYLFAESYVMLSNNALPLSIQAISKTIKTLCKGEINQFFSTCSFKSTFRNYLKRIDGKCACLFSLSLSIGAIDGNSDMNTIRKLKWIGHYVGMAFQIIDDILDITSPKEVLGKPAGNDIRQGIYTLPVLYEIQNENTDLKILIENNQINEALLILRESQGLKKTRDLAKIYTNKALELIEELPDITEKYILTNLVEKMLVREY